MAWRRDLLEVFQAGAHIGAVASVAPGLELVALVVVCGVCVVMQALISRRGAVKHGGGDHVAFQRLRRRYNVVYALGTFGDWIQGAYLYALYREHGFEMADIGYIFVLGYFASATLGTYVAALGDRHGHRRLVMLYGVSYGAACVATRRSDAATVVLSRVLSGVAYSLLFSSFESWAIAEVDRCDLPRKYLVQLFSTATFFNAASAVLAGLVGNFLVAQPETDPSDAKGGVSGNRYAPAFDAGAAALFLCALGAKLAWTEKKQGHDLASGEDDSGTGIAFAGDAFTNPAAPSAMKSGVAAVSSPRNPGNLQGVFRASRMVLAEPALLSLGSMNSLYEAALHVFVFVWTPALERRILLGDHVVMLWDASAFETPRSDPSAAPSVDSRLVPHGLVFSLFMACKMAGSQLYSLIGDRVPAEKTLRLVFIGSAVSFAVPLFLSRDGYVWALVSFCAFEFGLGLYWPAVAVARAELVPNHLRATMTSVFRIPLNVLVMACLAFAGNADEPSFLAMCLALMSACLLFSTRTARAETRIHGGEAKNEKTESSDERVGETY